MEQSLQKIEDYYFGKGLRGEDLREAVEADKTYQKILSARRKTLTKKFGVTEEDARKYVLSTDEDWEILGKIYQLEKKKLTAEDEKFITFLRTQLEHDWRAPIVQVLDGLIKKYAR